MKTTMRVFTVFFSVVMLGFFLMAFTPSNDGKPWEIPGKYKSMKNPHAGDKSLNNVGKMLYSKHCKSCHGSKGLGDGPKAKQLKTSCGDFSSEEFQGRADGVLYYQSFVGRDEMPNFEKKIVDEEDRWAVINFMRTMGK